ncbi:MAG: DNA polymerase III subunit beta [Desulfarculus sp.]|jgi:DNA polymerase-3 subunit beta|nr:MAG: DNA polymerase III subunit beta [Desulfarculus sp.]
MKATVSSKDLARLLATAKGLVERKAEQPALRNVLLQAEGTEVRLRATDLETTYIGACAAMVDEAGELCLPAHKLAEAAKALPAENAHLTAEGPDLVIEAAKLRYLLRGLDPVDFPAALEDDTRAVPLEAQALAGALNRVIFAAAKEDTRYNLAGVRLEVREDNADLLLRMVATNGHVLCLCDLDLDPADNAMALLEEFKAGALLPNRAAKAMLGMLPKEGEVTLGLGRDWTTLRVNGDLLRVRNPECDFPDYDKVIPSRPPLQAIVPRQKLVQVAKRVALIEGGRERRLTLKFSEGLLELSAANPDLGEAREHLEIEWPRGEMTLGLNARYLLDVCGALSSEEISLGIKDEHSQVTIAADSEGDSRFLGIIMPMRL